MRLELRVEAAMTVPSSPRALYKYFSRAGLLRFLDGLVVRFSPPIAFNDPFEALPAIVGLGTLRSKVSPVEYGDFLHAALARSFAPRIGTLCLSEDPLNLLMWGHYSSAHQGGVVEFDPAHAFLAGNATANGLYQCLRPVRYSELRAELALDHFRQHEMGALNDHGEGWLSLLESAHPVLFTKSLEWSYEREWRLVRQLIHTDDVDVAARRVARMFTGTRVDEGYVANPAPDPEELATVPVECVKTVFLGAKSRTHADPAPVYEELVLRALSKLPNSDHIGIHQVRIHPDQFKLIAFDLRDADAVRANVPPHEYDARVSGMEAIQFRRNS
jgi:hypothetical protein